MEEATAVDNVTELTTIPGPTTARSPDQTKSKPKKLVDLPLSRVKQIIKMDPEVSLVSTDAVFLIAKSAELFINALSKQAYVFTCSANKKTLQRKDIDSAIDIVDEYSFLEAALD